MRQLPFLICSIFFWVNSSIFCQQSEIYTNPLSSYQKGIHLLKSKHYLAAQLIFDKVQKTAEFEIASDCAFYSALASLRLKQENADQKMLQFIKEYPISTKMNSAYTELATYFFESGRYAYALEYFEKVDESALTRDELEKYYFYRGYTFFTTHDQKSAKYYFNRVVYSHEYGSKAKYYLGFLAYQGNQYEEANKYFDQVDKEDKYKEKLSYFQADMAFKSGAFQKSIDLGLKAMAHSSIEEKSELSKIIGESYFNLKEYDKSIPYLKAYQGREGKWNNTDFYQLGYAFYQKKDYETAIAYFNRIVEGNDLVAQNAYYHLGESYLKTDKKQQALNAFKNASEMIFDKKIQEDAYLNYAKLSYDIGNSYQTTPEILTGFLTKYPNTSHKNEIENLLINSFITSRNYKEALQLLEKNKSITNRIVYQKVAFYRGLELYADGNYNEALNLFKKSINEQKNLVFTARATFWKGETEFIKNDFSNALLSYKQFLGFVESKTTTENENINYNIAYTYFKLKEYEQASRFFQKHTENSKEDKTRLIDAYLRLADCYFVTSKYNLAIESYDKAIALKGIDTDYASFQKAISYGFAGKNDQKIRELNNFIKKFSESEYRDDAFYELANTYTTIGQSTAAIKMYDQLISEYNKGRYTAKAILRQGLIFYNEDKDDLALLKFKKVAQEYPGTEEANESVRTARLLYIDKGQVQEYANWIKTLEFVEVNDTELDHDAWEAVEKQYAQENKEQALLNLKSYINTFPNGKQILKAYFYLAELYYQKGAIDLSVSNYEYLVSKSRNEYTEQALTRLSELFLKKQNNTEQSIIYLIRLENESDFPQNKMYAQANLMKIYYEKKEYNNAVVYAEKVLLNPKTDNKLKTDAQIIIARAARELGDENKTKEAYLNVQKNAKGELMAEALYYDSFFKNKEGKFELSNAIVQKIAKEYSGYKYYGAKSLIIMAKNFYGLKDSYQASYILESVIKNFKNFQDVLTEAQEELNKIKAEEAKTNSSIKG
ncbi:tetratricopeptide repeat protein [Flavobacterium columnare]|uniref:Tetratricopeptide repeat protein n=1 Tax=Flavobacterium columnare TaxID=996 RepID=A0A437U9T7_9FLAO|nr:tetratricopeptide repeat protein [Flavobacterium columnare]RVU90390.1 tetratricopeptide repeat protein [Flavobacterium columnare]